MSNKVSKEIVINTGTFIGCQSSQVIGVTVTDDSITLEFAYINPRDSTKGQVVARVIVPISVGIDLADTIKSTALIHSRKKKGGQND